MLSDHVTRTILDAALSNLREARYAEACEVIAHGVITRTSHLVRDQPIALPTLSASSKPQRFQFGKYTPYAITALHFGLAVFLGFWGWRQRQRALLAEESNGGWGALLTVALGGAAVSSVIASEGNIPAMVGLWLVGIAAGMVLGRARQDELGRFVLVPLIIFMMSYIACMPELGAQNAGEWFLHVLLVAILTIVISGGILYLVVGDSSSSSSYSSHSSFSHRSTTPRSPSAHSSSSSSRPSSSSSSSRPSSSRSYGGGGGSFGGGGASSFGGGGASSRW
ncbi:MAG: hypothetical protein H0U74_09110 [Bradymonadaceae bacterium]|nr:hypothetical protein [Lujinxingiaceae bacterium]